MTDVQDKPIIVLEYDPATGAGVERYAVRCDLCGALTLTADMELHAKWHRRADCRELVRLR